MNADTICALATPTGGAIAIIRISGPLCFDILSSVCCNANTSKNRFLSPITDSEGHTIDETLVSLFHAPHSYTGEDSIEISCHGSQYIAQQILDLLIQHGCRMAHPGEFTQRAFLNGKMDLSQAEAVADLIASTNKATHQLAISQLRGGISSELFTLREQLLKLTSLLELELDFSDHEDLEFADRSELMALTQKIDVHIVRLANSFETGQALKQGIPVAIVGKTNVGKSTLLNQLIGDERAIVSDIHGTTRDTIEDAITIQGIQFRFIDTAGLRETTDIIEKIGIERTYVAIDKARIVLWLFDEAPTTDEIADMQKRCEGKQLLVIQNKIDKNEDASISNLPSSIIKISAKHGTNLPDLKTAILRAANIPEITENDIIVTNARHYEALTQAHTHLQRVLDGLSSHLSGDLIAEDLRLVLTSLGEITGGGTITSQETLNNIFSHFCVGK